MEKMDIHIVGLGNLGSAFLKGLSDLHEKTDIYLYDESKNARQLIQENYSLTPKESVNMISKGVLILCIKPQNINEFFDIYKDKIAKDVLDEVWQSGEDVAKIIEGQGMQQISDEGELEKIIDKILTENTSQVEAYKSGKDKLFGFFVGQVMKATQGKANPNLANKLLKNKLS